MKASRSCFAAAATGLCLLTLLSASLVRAAPRLYRVPAELGGEFEGDCTIVAARAKGIPVVAFGVYEGRQMTRTVVGKTPHETYIVPVTGPRAGPRRVLWLSSYEAVIWDFSQAPNQRIEGVVLSGYYDQAVMNLPADVPVRFSSLAKPGPCGRIGFAYEGGPNLEAAVAQLQNSTGLMVESFSGTYKVGALRLDSVLTSSDVVPPIRPGTIRSAVTVARDVVEPREAGIAQLIAQGKLRRATQFDVDRWNATATARLATGRLAAYREEHLRVDFSFVVLAPLRIPRGMYGAHSAEFLIMPGVPDPTDPGSHNTYYRIADGTCQGTNPNCNRLPR